MLYNNGAGNLALGEAEYELRYKRCQAGIPQRHARGSGEIVKR